jgi:hypothetical protein
VIRGDLCQTAHTHKQTNSPLDLTYLQSRTTFEQHSTKYEFKSGDDGSSLMLDHHTEEPESSLFHFHVFFPLLWEEKCWQKF